MERISVSLPRPLLEKFDRVLKEKGYLSRSEGIRDSIRSYMAEHSLLSRLEGEISGIVSLIYNHEEHSTSEELTDIQHEFSSIIQSSIHIHLDERHCLEAVVVRGEGSKVREFVNRAGRSRGVRGVKLAANVSEVPE